MLPRSDAPSPLSSSRRGVYAKGENATTHLLSVALAGERADTLGDWAVEVKAVAAPAL